MIGYQTISIIIACIGVTTSVIIGVACKVSRKRKDVR